MLFAICAYCKGYGHYKSHCLKLITKPLPSPKHANLCRDYNPFKFSECQDSKNNRICKNGREHKCLICLKSECKAYFHLGSFKIDNPTHTSKSSFSDSSVLKEIIDLVKDIGRRLQLFRKDLDEIKTKQEVRDYEKLLSETKIKPSSKMLDLSHSQYLAMPIISANKELSMPISTGFPSSVVSTQHAAWISSSSTRDDLDQQIMSPFQPELLLADRSTLPMNRTINVPITFPHGETHRFQMIVAENLSHDIIFGQNHLSKLDAIISFSPPKVVFRHPDNVDIPCKLMSTPNYVRCLTSIFDIP